MLKRKGLLITPLLLLSLTLASVTAAFGDPTYTREEHDYQVPDVTLYNQDGKEVKLVEYMKTDKPVIVDFVYATCTTICPVLSASFKNFQTKSGVPTQSVKLVSFSIDPENDTPEVMKEYLARYRAKPGWDFFTGNREDIDKVMIAFDAYVPDKMSHMPITFFKSPKSETWVRIYGLMGTSDIIREYQEIAK